MARRRHIGLTLGLLAVVWLFGTSAASDCTETETRTFGSLKIEVGEPKLNETTRLWHLPATLTNTKSDRSYTLKTESFTLLSREGGKYKVVGSQTTVLEPSGTLKTTLEFGYGFGCPTTLHFVAQGFSLTAGDIPLPGDGCE